MDVSTLAIALGYTKKQVEEAKKEGFKVQVEQDRSILDRVGEEKVFYFLPKSVAESQDGYDEFVYTNNNWEKIGTTSVDLSSYATKEWTLEQIEESMTKDIASASINQNGTITFTMSDGSTVTTTGESVIGPQGPQGIQGEPGAQGAPGAKGDSGATGVDGFSPTATITQTQSGATVTITDKNGTTTANISNGAPGQDYVLTAQDKDDIADIVLAEFTGSIVNGELNTR